MKPVDVIASSGYKADERPQKLFLDGRWQNVRRVTRSESIETRKGRLRSRRFFLELEDGKNVTLLRDDEEGAWYLR